MIDQIDDNNLRKSLKDQGGFALTHIGKIRKRDGGNIDYRTAKELLYCLGYFLSFLTGLWSFPLLCGGLRTGCIVWQEWHTPHLAPWPHYSSQKLTEPVPWV